jgi:hypothetical protein
MEARKKAEEEGKWVREAMKAHAEKQKVRKSSAA